MLFVNQFLFSREFKISTLFLVILLTCLMCCPYLYLQCNVIQQTIIYTMFHYPMDHIDSIKQFTYIILRNVMLISQVLKSIIFLNT
jgi:hypothetical protein